jgi:hypothetical protein
MSATLTAPGMPFLDPAAEGRSRPHGLTLEQRLEGTWEGLRSGGPAACPLCRAPMQRAADGSGHCSDCGARLY